MADQATEATWSVRISIGPPDDHSTYVAVEYIYLTDGISERIDRAADSLKQSLMASSLIRETNRQIVGR